MKVGDLVQFSAYGSARHYNRMMFPASDFDIAGILVKIHDTRNYPYKVLWNASTHTYMDHLRIELKFARKVNENR
jgi:hypothetical protein